MFTDAACFTLNNIFAIYSVSRRRVYHQFAFFYECFGIHYRYISLATRFFYAEMRYSVHLNYLRARKDFLRGFQDIRMF